MAHERLRIVTPAGVDGVGGGVARNFPPPAPMQRPRWGRPCSSKPFPSPPRHRTPPPSEIFAPAACGGASTPAKCEYRPAVPTLTGLSGNKQALRKLHLRATFQAPQRPTGATAIV